MTLLFRRVLGSMATVPQRLTVADLFALLDLGVEGEVLLLRLWPPRLGPLATSLSPPLALCLSAFSVLVAS
jgi:hypothetical protein